jgi:hypothetical protein
MNGFQVKNFIRLRSIFRTKEWDKNVEEEYVFASFSELLNNLTEDEQELMLDLIERYLWIDNSKYIPLLRDVLTEKGCSDDLGAFKNVYFFPVIKPKDQNKTKSGNLLIYQIQTIKRMLIEPLKSRNIQVLENFADLSEDIFQLTEDDVLVLIDDFLGTGKTIDSTIQKVLENKTIKASKIRVVGFTALKIAIDFLNDNNIRSYMLNVLLKGITDHYAEDRLVKLALMKKIEKMSIASKNYKMGFEGSEALVTMARTPNNTFSIFWASHVKDDKEYSAAFPRF